MANARIEAVGPAEYGLIADLYNSTARPPVDAAYFERRLAYHAHTLVLVAELDRQPVGFTCGYELRPTTFYSWLYGVLPNARGLGIGSQLMDALHAWVQEHGYEMIRLECYNQHREMILLAVKRGYDIVGVRWDSHTASNLVIFEKQVHAGEA